MYDIVNIPQWLTGDQLSKERMDIVVMYMVDFYNEYR